MCLDVIVKDTLTEKEQSGEGYKIFASLGDKIFPEYPREQQNYKSYKRGIWLKAKRVTVTLFETYGRYETGFHILMNLTDASNWLKSSHVYAPVIYKVKYRKARLLGKQSNKDIIIADEMRILGKEKTCQI